MTRKPGLRKPELQDHGLSIIVKPHQTLQPIPHNQPRIPTIQWPNRVHVRTRIRLNRQPTQLASLNHRVQNSCRRQSLIRHRHIKHRPPPKITASDDRSHRVCDSQLSASVIRAPTPYLPLGERAGGGFSWDGRWRLAQIEGTVTGRNPLGAIRAGDLTAVLLPCSGGQLVPNRWRLRASDMRLDRVSRRSAARLVRCLRRCAVAHRRRIRGRAASEH